MGITSEADGARLPKAETASYSLLTAALVIHFFVSFFSFTVNMEPTRKQTTSIIVGAVWLLQMLYFQGKGSQCAHVYDIYECTQGHVQPLWVILETSHCAGGGKSLPLGGWTLGGIDNTHPLCGRDPSCMWGEYLLEEDRDQYP